PPRTSTTGSTARPSSTGTPSTRGSVRSARAATCSRSTWCKRSASVADDVMEQLSGPGAPFEIVVEDVLGHPTQVYKQRMKSLRELVAQNALRADVDWLVQGDRRYTYGEHDGRVRRLAKSLAHLGGRCGRRAR